MTDKTDFRVHQIEDRIADCKKHIQLLRETFDRRFSPDEVMEARFGEIECEMSLLTTDVRKLRKELGGAAQ